MIPAEDPEQPLAQPVEIGEIEESGNNIEDAYCVPSLQPLAICKYSLRVQREHLDRPKPRQVEFTSRTVARTFAVNSTC